MSKKRGFLRCQFLQSDITYAGHNRMGIFVLQMSSKASEGLEQEGTRKELSGELQLLGGG